MNNYLDLGQSKSGISVESSESGLMLKKKFPDANRGYKQYLKHQDACHLSNKNSFLVPKILSEFTNSAYYMQYMHATPLGFGLDNMSLEEVKEITDKLVGYFEKCFILESKKINTNVSLLKNKLEDLARSPCSKDLLYSKALDFLRNSLPAISVPEGWNHGDLSLDNILINYENFNLIFIDFLNSPFESPLIDLGRILLDLKYGWWKNSLNPSLTWVTNSKYISRQIIEVGLEFGIPRSTINYFIIFAALRVIPYTSNPARMAYLKTAIYQCMEVA